MSDGGTGARSGLGLRSMKSGEAVRLIVAVVLAAGAVALVESLTHGGQKSAGSAARPGQSASSGSAATPGSSGTAAGAHGSGSAGAQSSASSAQGGHVVVAGGPAVTRSLQHGSMTVVIDEPASGMFAEQNRSIAQGAEVAAAELNGSGGLARHVHLKLLRQGLDGLSASAVQARLRSEAAAALILPCDTDTQSSLAAAGAQFGMLMLAPCNPDSTAGGRYATYWPIGMSSSEEAAGLASFMHTIGYGSAFVVTAPGSAYVEQLSSEFRNAAKAAGIQLPGEASIATTTQDFSALAHAIEAVHPKPSAIFTALPPPLVNRMAAGLLAQGVHATVIGGTAMDTRLTLSSGSTALENAVFASYGFPRLSASANRFAADYRRRFGAPAVGAFPGLGAETIRLIEDAVRKAGSAEPSAIQQALAGGITLNGVELAERAYEHGGDHNPVGTVAISKVSFGAFLPLVVTTPSGASAP